MMLHPVYGVYGRVARDADGLPRVTPLRSVRNRPAPSGERAVDGTIPTT
jgi:hypothetical protein